jgi:osmotically inducible protein OsmC
MALSHALAGAGTPPERLETAVTVTFQPGEGITRIRLTVRGRVPGIDEDAIRSAAEDAKQNCPVSKALTGVPEVTVAATLAAT